MIIPEKELNVRHTREEIINCFCDGLQKKTEAILEGMAEESLRMIHSTGMSDAKNAWYYSHLGSLDFAMQMGLISEKRRQELYREFNRAIESNDETMKQ